MEQTVNHIYIQEIHRNLPRLLSFFNPDQISPFYGVGDRDYWGWKTKDFINGTYQGAAHGLAILLRHDFLPDFLSKDDVTTLIDAIFMGTKAITRADGSLEEAFPYEKSFCVTSLVAYDLTSCLLHLKGMLAKEQLDNYCNIISPLIAFTAANNETHGIVSNHLASAAAALVKWDQLTKRNHSIRIKQLMSTILNNQSGEGWYREYDGADVGYQSLATSYLLEVYQTSQDATLLKSIERAVDFFQYFVHPHGHLGGVYGSRNTAFFYPDGFEGLENGIATSIATQMRAGIANYKCVTLSAIDAPNFVPMFNSYCRAAAYALKNKAQPSKLLPFQADKVETKIFADAGLCVRNGENYYAVFSMKKGGSGVVSDKSNNGTAVNYYGPLYRSGDDYFTTQGNEGDYKYQLIDQNTLEVTAPLYPYGKMYPRPYQYIILRLLNISVMRIPFLNEILKKLLVRFVIKGAKVKRAENTRTIHFDKNVDVTDAVFGDDGLKNIPDHDKDFYAIHMASQGYWKRK